MAIIAIAVKRGLDLANKAQRGSREWFFTNGFSEVSPRGVKHFVRLGGGAVNREAVLPSFKDFFVHLELKHRVFQALQISRHKSGKGRAFSFHGKPPGLQLEPSYVAKVLEGKGFSTRAIFGYRGEREIVVKQNGKQVARLLYRPSKDFSLFTRSAKTLANLATLLDNAFHHVA